MAYIKTLSNRPRVQTGIMTLKDKQLECMHHLGSSLRRVRLGGNICLSPSAIATFLQKAGKNLQELDLSGCQVNDEVYLIFLAHTIARLRSIHNSLAHALRSTMPREVPAAPRLNKTLRASQVRLLFNTIVGSLMHATIPAYTDLHLTGLAGDRNALQESTGAVFGVCRQGGVADVR